ncbi:MAG: hypothetical protein K9I94_04330 [Bacteroidales bacterium]|nr:hypothetical protein [Bacteroidales bacterium]
MKVGELSGKSASVYSIVFNNKEETLLDQFIRECIISFKNETKDIVKRLKTIGSRTGARTHFFKEFEGEPGDGVCALYDKPGSNLRLYCIRYGTQILVVGSGGPKNKTIRAFQEDKKLKNENYFLRWLSSQITERIRGKDITFINDGFDLKGNLEFEINEK